MTHATDATNNENDDLICPITLELFRDPVIAEDGRVYEREAITRWILEHGTSPFTRQQLQINNLQPDVHLRCLARRRRNSTVSYNARNDVVTLPPLRGVPRNITQVFPQQYPVVVTRNQSTSKFVIEIICCVILSNIIVVPIILGVAFGIKASNSDSYSTEIPTTSNYAASITTSYSGSITTNYSLVQQWWRTGRHYYQPIQVVVSINGLYEFRSFSQIDMYGCLYSPYFNATDPIFNLLAYNDNSGGNNQFYFRISLQPLNYTLVVTTYYANVTGTFSIVVSGPTTVILRR